MNYHMHSSFSCDCSASMRAMVLAAVAANIAEIGFNEHFDNHPQDECMGYFEVDAWWQEITKCREEFEGSLIIKAGIEIGEPHRFSDVVDAMLNGYPWDYVIGALHRIGKQTIFHESYYAQSKTKAHEKYFNAVHEMVGLGRFHILAHMDLIKRYGVEHYGAFDPQEYEHLIRPILHSLADRDLALEVNTIPLRRPVREASPSLKILQWFREEGGTHVTIGSDAHKPDEVNSNLEEAISLVIEAGFDTLTTYQHGMPFPIPLTSANSGSLRPNS